MQRQDIQAALVEIRVILEKHTFNTPHFNVNKALEDFKLIQERIQILVEHIKNLTPQERLPLLEYIKDMKNYLDQSMDGVKDKIDLLSTQMRHEQKHRVGTAIYQQKVKHDGKVGI